MADYEPTTWECGDVITAEKMNKIERGVTDIMSEYVPTEWQCGDTITAEKMNKIEQGIANCGGGSSDFSTATITTAVSENDVTAAAYFYLPIIADAPYSAELLFYDGLTNTFDIPLYNGVSYLKESEITVYVSGTWAQGATCAFSGNIELGEIDGENVILIKGDCTCTITIS